MTDFDPAAHRMVTQQRWFQDFVLGERFVLPSRTMTGAVFAAFQAASGDTHPVHYDVEYCRARGMPNLLAHGFQTLEDDCELLYLTSTPYAQAAEDGLNPTDSRLDIAWPLPITECSDRDRNHPPLTHAFAGMDLSILTPEPQEQP